MLDASRPNVGQVSAVRMHVQSTVILVSERKFDEATAERAICFNLSRGREEGIGAHCMKTPDSYSRACYHVIIRYTVSITGGGAKPT